MKVADNSNRTHNPFEETYWVSCLMENIMSSSYGEELETGHQDTAPVLYPTYHHGLNYQNDIWLYINPGTATWGPVNRFGVSSEITVMRFK